MTKDRGYQLHLSRGDTVLSNVQGRTQKFRKILRVLHDVRPGLDSLTCLDIGSSSGVITSLLAEAFSMAVGLEIDRDAVTNGEGRSASSGGRFVIGDAMTLPFKAESVDVVICNHVYEHVPSAEKMMDEIYRVLKGDGFCYFSAGNKYMLLEGHYFLPLLSWLPKPLAHLYLRLTRKGNFYYEEHRSLRGLKRLARRFTIRDFTIPIIRDPEAFCATDLFATRSLLYKAIRLLAPYLYACIPTYVWVLRKR